MSRTPRWKKSGTADGVLSVELSHWKYFHDFVLQEVPHFQSFVWRGQRDAAWPLESSLDRQIGVKGVHARTLRAAQHLERFKLAVRGRRGPNPVRIQEESEWWALGQHHGLATPLLDWTESPYVALYFAFERALRPSGGKRAVWGLLSAVSNKNKEILAHHESTTPTPKTPAPTLDFVRPYQDENSRLVSQAGLFTRVPLGETVDNWVKTHYAGQSQGVLLRMSLPNTDRSDCLKSLNRMNINHVSLFPDLYGASQHCNKSLEIYAY